MTETLTVATGDYLHVRGLEGMSVGDELRITKHHIDKPSRIFSQALSDAAPYDVAEASLATTWMLAAGGDTRFVPLPVFTSRMFRWSSLYVRAGTAPLASAAPLRVGMVRFGQTAAVWARALLREALPANAPAPQWWIAQTQPWLPTSLEVRKAEDQGALEQMLLAGELDVLISTRLPRGFTDGQVTRLFADWTARERQALDAGKPMPIMHTLLLRRTLLARWPTLAPALVALFEQARDQAWAWLTDTDKSGLPVPSQHAWLEAVGGPGAASRVWPYGLAANREVLVHFAQLMHAQRLTPVYVPPEQVFS